jgi:hypothetical protein
VAFIEGKKKKRRIFADATVETERETVIELASAQMSRRASATKRMTN